MCIRVLAGGNKQYADVGDVIVASVKQAHAGRLGQEGRRGQGGHRADGQGVRPAGWLAHPLRRQRRRDPDHDASNPRGTRIFGPVARELRERNFMKIISLAPEVL